MLSFLSPDICPPGLSCTTPDMLPNSRRCTLCGLSHMKPRQTRPNVAPHKVNWPSGHGLP